MTIQHPTTAGTLDPDFGLDGVVFIDVPGYEYCDIESIKAASDGRIYVAGHCYNRSGNISRYVLGRFHLDGTLDQTFGNSGLVVGGFEDRSSTINALLLGDTHILLYGGSGNIDTGQTPSFARYSLNGVLDTTFANNGYAVLNQLAAEAPTSSQKKPDGDGSHALSGPGIFRTSPDGVEWLPDGKILAYTGAKFQRSGLVFRLTANGVLDESFNHVGYVEFDDGSRRTALTNVMLHYRNSQPGYLGCGWAFDKALFIRYTPDGKLDQGFGSDGIVSISDPAMGSLFAYHMARQPNERILGAGNTSSPGRAGMLISLEPDGTPSIQFNRGKPVYTALEPDEQTQWWAGVISGRGKIVAVGGVSYAGEVDIVVARFIDGVPDTSFNGQGWVRTHIGTGIEYASDVAVQADEKILVATHRNVPRGLILRYLG